MALLKSFTLQNHNFAAGATTSPVLDYGAADSNIALTFTNTNFGSQVMRLDFDISQDGGNTFSEVWTSGQFDPTYSDPLNPDPVNVYLPAPPAGTTWKVMATLTTDSPFRATVTGKVGATPTAAVK